MEATVKSRTISAFHVLRLWTRNFCRPAHALSLYYRYVYRPAYAFNLCYRYVCRLVHALSLCYWYVYRPVGIRLQMWSISPRQLLFSNVPFPGTHFRLIQPRSRFNTSFLTIPLKPLSPGRQETLLSTMLRQHPISKQAFVSRALVEGAGW